jgi:hypothetical protein
MNSTADILSGLARLKPTPHPMLDWPFTQDDLLRAAHKPEFAALIHKHHAAREDRILRSREDPLRYGFEWKEYADADALLARKRDIAVFGSNRASKSWWAAKKCVQKLVEKPNATVWAFCQSNETSIRKDGQQQLIWHFLPPEWKALAKRARSGLAYSEKNKFADNAFVTPTGGEMRFMNYEQDIGIVEGPPIDLFWCDELVPVEWVITLRGRIVDRNGNGITTFTPIYGYNDTVGEYVNEGTVREWEDCELLPDTICWPGGAPGKVPYVVDSLDPACGAIFFQARRNPFINYEALRKTWQGAGVDVILSRLHGVARRRAGATFPTFGKHHIIEPDQVVTHGTDFHFLDFAGNRPWAMLWLRVVRISDRRFIYAVADWPDKATFGEWVLRSSKKKDGEKGPAQSHIGYGTREYRDTIETLESRYRLSAAVRTGDPRSGNVVNLTEEHGGTNILQLMAEQGVFIEPGKGDPVAHKIGIINSWLSGAGGADESGELPPRLLISSRCEQLIDCLRIWTGADGQKGASKDFVDLLGFAAVADLDEWTPTMWQQKGGFSY